ncbi:Uncharacterized protein FKW44_016875, partial [Caligus rogercresseyi]
RGTCILHRARHFLPRDLAVLPYSLVALSWLLLADRARRILGRDLPGLKAKKRNPTKMDFRKNGGSESDELSRDRDNDDCERNSFQRRGRRGWTVFLRCRRAPQIFKKSSTACVLRAELNTNLNIVSLVLMIPLPLLAQAFLSVFSLLKRSNCVSDSGQHSLEGHAHYYSRATYALLFLLTLVFAIGYPVNMFFRNHIRLHALKFVFGYLHILLIPVFIILTRKTF